MSFENLINSLNQDTLGSLALFRPELTISATIVSILLLRVLNVSRLLSPFLVTLAGSGLALGFAVASWHAGDVPREQLFTGMLIYDSLTVYLRIVLLLFLVLFTIFTRVSGVPDRDAAADVYPLVLGATLGMCLMASANHLLIVFLGVEMASVPSYALAGMLKGRKRSSEAALKYAVYGAGTAGIMLYGISLLGGVLGSYHLPTMAARLSELLGSGTVHEFGANEPLVLMLGGLMLMVGLSFKLSAVPFHFWCPDVFEGATAEVNAFLSVASKAAALGLLVRMAIGFGALPQHPAVQVAAGPVAPASAKFSVADASAMKLAVADASAATFTDATAAIVVADEAVNNPATATVTGQPSPAAAHDHLGPAREFISKLIALLAVITCTFGNLAAYGQTNIKRLLAYSTIAHAGYMMMPVAAAVALAGRHPEAAEKALAALMFYIGVYLFMNLGAFAIVAFLRNVLGSEQIADYAGLIRRAPGVTVCFALLLFSLIGLPPLGGFIGKFFIFASLVEADLMLVLVIGGLNTALSLFYYLRVVKVMTIDPQPEQSLPITIPFIPGTLIAVLTLPVLVLGVWFNEFYTWALGSVAHLLS